MAEPQRSTDAPAKANGGAPRKAAQPRVEYGGDSVQNLVVSVRGFRLMVGLMLVNTVLIASTVLGPQLFPFMRGQWQNWQARRAAAARVKAEAVLLQQCLTHRMPEGRVIYEEDPDAATKLLTAGAGTYQAAAYIQHAPPGWVPPVTAAPPPYYGQFLPVAFGRPIGGENQPLLFLHERTTPGGQKHLVTVSLAADFDADQPRTRPRDAGIGGPNGGDFGFPERGDEPRGMAIQPGETVFVMRKRRMLSVVTYLAGQGGKTLDFRGKRSALTRSLMLDLPDSKARVLARTMDDASPDAPPTLDYGNRLRFLAGQPDPNDPSHLTIPYQLDGRDGVIDVWVKDQGIDLRPREGQRSFGTEGEIWKPPTTRPAAQPTPAADAPTPAGE